MCVVVFFFLEKIISCACLVRSALNGIFHWYAQSCIFNRSLLSVEAEVFTLFTMLNKELSSAKSLSSELMVIVIPILILAVRQLLLKVNWKIDHSKRLFDVCYEGMTQSNEEHSRLSHCF